MAITQCNKDKNLQKYFQLIFFKADEKETLGVCVN